MNTLNEWEGLSRARGVLGLGPGVKSSCVRVLKCEANFDHSGCVSETNALFIQFKELISL